MYRAVALRTLFAQRTTVAPISFASRALFSTGNLSSLGDFHSAIEDSLARKDTAQARKYFDELQKKQVKPDASTYLLMIRGMAHNDQLEQATELFQHMVKSDVKPNADVYEALLDGISRHLNRTKTSMN